MPLLSLLTSVVFSYRLVPCTGKNLRNPRAAPARSVCAPWTAKTVPVMIAWADLHAPERGDLREQVLETPADTVVLMSRRDGDVVVV